MSTSDGCTGVRMDEGNSLAALEHTFGITRRRERERQGKRKEGRGVK